MIPSRSELLQAVEVDIHRRQRTGILPAFLTNPIVSTDMELDWRRRKPGPWRLFAVMLLTATTALLSGGCRSQPILTEDFPSEDLPTRVRGLIEAENHGDAEELLEVALDRELPDSIREELSFLFADNDYKRRKIRRSATRFRRFVRDYPFSTRLPEVEETVFQIALLQLDGQDKGFLGIGRGRAKAVETLEYLRETFPRGARAADVLKRLGDYYVDRRYYEDAVFEYETLSRDHPESEWQPLALYRAALCYLLQSRGAAYDLEVLGKARYGFQQYLETYPEGTHRSEAEAALDIIAELFEERAYSIGESYEKRNRPRGALLSYRRALDLFPNSEEAERARSRISALEPLVEEIERKEEAKLQAAKESLTK